MSQKQNEMYQLASRYNLPSQVKNEALGLWYDAKTRLATLMTELKADIAKKGMLMPGGTQEMRVPMELKREVERMRRKQQEHGKAVQKLRSALKFKEGLIRDEQQKLESLIRELRHTELPTSGDRVMMSPFERKIATYQKSAELRHNERSGSRGRPVGVPMSNTGSNFYNQ